MAESTQPMALRYYLRLERVLLQRSMPRMGQRWMTANLRWEPLALDRPMLPEHWVALRPLMTGICGSDLALLRGHSSPYLAPVTSFPAVLGHEIVAEVIEPGHPLFGQRVAVDPTLGCQARGLPLCEACQDGRRDDCLRRADPGLGPGILLGYHQRLPGGWSQKMWAPADQLVPVPESFALERAVLVEPAAIVLAGLRRVQWEPVSTVLVIGTGPLGLLALAFIRTLYPSVALVALSRYPRQAELARLMGAQTVLPGPDRTLDAVTGQPSPGMWGAPAYRPRGFDLTVVTAGSAQAVEQGMTLTRPDGQVLLLGGAGHVALDLTPLWFRRLRVIGSYGYGPSGTNTFHTVVSLLTLMQQPLEALVTHRFPLADYREAFARITQRDAIKVVLTP